MVAPVSHRDSPLFRGCHLTVTFAALYAGCQTPPARAPEARAPRLELVESVPLETTLDHPDVADAKDVWPRMFAEARERIDVAQFYASTAEPAGRPDDFLTPSLDALRQAARRGVRVRFLADAVFAKKYPEPLAAMRGAGVVVRVYDVERRSGGVLHAKYFVVDGAHAFVGSQNFDWRALAHIQEMGVAFDAPSVVGPLTDVFETDWALAGGAPDDARVTTHPGAPAVAAGGETFELVASPGGWLPSEASWELPRLVRMLDDARCSIDLQLLSYKASSRDGSPFTTLDVAMRRAARRGVRVRLLVSEWGARPDARAAPAALLTEPNVDVSVLTIPPFSAGAIPFARVAHAKYLVVDGRPECQTTAHAWVGSSNWEGDYFTRSRNVGVVVTGGALPKRLARIFQDGFGGAYAKPLTPSSPASAAPPSSNDPARP